MKKILCVLLAAAVVLSAAGALAQTVTTELMVLPNGVTVVLEHGDGELLCEGGSTEPGFGRWMVDDGVHTAVSLRIAPSEIDAQLSLGDLTEEEQMFYGRQVGEMFADPVIDLHTTPSGNLYLHIASNEESDMDVIFTIYKGFFVELTQFRHDFGSLTQEDMNFILDLLYGIEFVQPQ